MMTLFTIFLVGCVHIAWLVLRRCCFSLKPHTLRVPPGPKGSFFTGVKSQLSTSPWLKYAQWSEYYQSSVISFWVYNRRIVVLNDHKSVRDLLDKRAAIYSDRPKSWMYHELCGRGKAVFNISSLDSRHGKYRRLLQNTLSGRAIQDFYDLLQSEADVFVNSLTRDPKSFQLHLRRNAAAVIMKVAYGYTVTEDNDPFIGIAEEGAKISGWALAPGRWLVDYYPIVRFLPSWLPFMGFKRQGEIWRRRLEHLSDVPHKWVKDQMERGDFVESFTSKFLKSSRWNDAEADDIVKWAAGGLYAGASDTTVSALTSFLLLMALHPAVQRRAQREIDSFEQELSITDLRNLKYLIAVYKESMRYAPVSNIALSHRVIQDDIYECYKIPRDSHIIANNWAIFHDPSLYPNPFEFNPCRFLDSNDGDGLIGPANLNPDPRNYGFGYGRRSCPGIQFAETSMLLIMYRVLSRFDISLPPGTNAPEVEFTPGITSHIKPFDIVIQSRQ